MKERERKREREIEREHTHAFITDTINLKNSEKNNFLKIAFPFQFCEQLWARKFENVSNEHILEKKAKYKANCHKSNKFPIIIIMIIIATFSLSFLVCRFVWIVNFSKKRNEMKKMKHKRNGKKPAVDLCLAI